MLPDKDDVQTTARRAANWTENSTESNISHMADSEQNLEKKQNPP